MSFDPGDIRILLAAAAPRVQVAAKRVLIEEGYRVVSAVDGRAALEVIEENPPDLVITVLDLPHARGIELAARARQLRPEAAVPCLFLVQAADERAFETTEWDLVLHLPFAATELIERVASLVEALSRQAPPVTEVPVHVPQVAWQYDLEHAGEQEAPSALEAPAVDFDLDAPAGTGEAAPSEAAAPEAERAAPELAEIAEAMLARLPEGDRHGDLSDRDLGALFIVAADAGFTGALRLEAGRLEKTIHFRYGRPIFCSSNLLSETLGEYLFRQRVISSGALARSVEQMISDGIRQGEALVSQGAVTREQLAVALAAHVRRKVVNAFAWNVGTFEFRPLESTRRPMLAVEMQPLWIIADAVRLFTAPQHFLHFYDEHWEAYVVPAPTFARHTGALATIPGGRALLEAIDGRRTVEAIQRESGLDELMLAQLLITLGRGALVTFADSPASRPAPAPRASDAVIGEMAASVFADWGALVDRPEAPQLDEAQMGVRDEVLAFYTSLPGIDPFSLLDVDPGAGAAELAQAYEAALSRFAPERFADFPDEETRRMAGEIYRRVIAAYEAIRSESGAARARELRKEDEAQIAKRSGVLHADLRYRWGRELLEEGKPEAALKQFVEAGRRNPDEPVYLLYAGWAGYLTGRQNDDHAMVVQGRQRIEKALEMMPVLVEGHRFLAEIARDAGDRELALDHLERAVTLDPNDRGVRRLFEALRHERGA